MLAREIAVGDVLKNENGSVFYTVEEVWTEGHDVLAKVRYVDFGEGIRVWDAERTVPLTRGPVD